MINFKVLPNLNDCEAVKVYLQDLASRIENVYKVNNIKIEYDSYFEIMQIKFDYINKQDNSKWLANISLYDPTNNDCFEDKTCCYRFNSENPKTWEGFGAIKNVKDLIWTLDNYVGKNEIEEIRLF